jgi:hypothetical protein
MNPRNAFNRGRIQLNNPTAIVILPMEEWTHLRAFPGYIVDYPLEVVRDEWGNIVPLDTIWETVEIEILPEARVPHTLTMALAGIVDTGTIAFYVMKENSQLVKDAFGILVKGVRYSVYSISDEPIGNPMFTLVTCKLWQ